MASSFNRSRHLHCSSVPFSSTVPPRILYECFLCLGFALPVLRPRLRSLLTVPHALGVLLQLLQASSPSVAFVIWWSKPFSPSALVITFHSQLSNLSLHLRIVCSPSRSGQTFFAIFCTDGTQRPTHNFAHVFCQVIFLTYHHSSLSILVCCLTSSSSACTISKSHYTPESCTL